MSFRRRLLLFFMIIVIVPMIAVALVLFSLIGESETGKADARTAQALQVAFSLYDEKRATARSELARITGDPGLRSAVAAGDLPGLRRTVDTLLREHPAAKSIVVYDRRRRPLVEVGRRDTIALATASPTQAAGRRIGTIALSTTIARRFASELRRMTALDTRIFRGDERLASTLRESGAAKAESGDVEIGGESYRGRFGQVPDPVGPPVQIGLFEQAEGISDSIDNNRALIGGILLAFFALALASSVFVVRALQSQIEKFLEAARALGAGDFDRRVPTEGGDEFAALGEEFNTMSQRLASNIEEVRRKGEELEETIRRVGDAFAAGLDSHGIVKLAVETSVEACSAEAGRAVPIESDGDGVAGLQPTAVGSGEPPLVSALEAAERQVLEAVTDRGPGADPPDEPEPGTTEPDRAARRGPVRAHVDGVHALAMALLDDRRAPTGAREGGVISIARSGEDFSESEWELFAYLAAQARVSLENVRLHETIQMRAVTDELTGLHNLRRFHEMLDREIERYRRFDEEVGLIMLDIDDFKRINDTYGHQQGDVVLVEVGRVLRERSREIDEPARYGGEELIVVLPETDLEGSELLAERIRAAIESLEIPRLDAGDPLRITASFGVSSLPACASSKEALISGADGALYRAKRGGKNRVERAEPATAPR